MVRARDLLIALLSLPLWLALAPALSLFFGYARLRDSYSEEAAALAFA